MPVANVVVQNNFTAPHRTHPPVPAKLFIDANSIMMFKMALDKVAFTGVVYLPQNIIYLHPLVAVPERGNAEIGALPVVKHTTRAGTLEGRKSAQPILHPNLSPTLRAQKGLTSGHSQICKKHDLPEEHCIGFAVLKMAGQNLLTTNSRTLNSERFMKSPRGVATLPPNLRAIFDKPQISDGALNKEWAYLIAVTIEIASTRGITNPSGNYEAPF